MYFNNTVFFKQHTVFFYYNKLKYYTCIINLIIIYSYLGMHVLGITSITMDEDMLY